MATETGGAGGSGAADAAGGAGANVDVDNIAQGAASDASVSLLQTANGGAGGASTGGKGGAAGYALSTLTVDGKGDTFASGTSDAVGGQGGGSQGSVAGTGGAAVSYVEVIGSTTTSIDVTANATGGGGGAASSGSDNGAGGSAAATGVAEGGSGTLEATASSSAATGALVTGVSASTQGSVSGKSTAAANSNIGGALASFNQSDQVLADVAGAPTSASTATILADNSAIKSAFGSSPVFFATAELGGAHSNAATGSQQTTSLIAEDVDLTQLAKPEDLVVGFYNGASVGAGVTQVTFNLFVNGSDVDSQTFSTAAAAKAYFTDNSINLGSLSGESSLSVEAELTVTTSTAGSGFYGDLIVGDPPAPRIDPKVVAFAQTAAAFAPEGAANMTLSSLTAANGQTPFTLAARGLGARYA